MIRWLRAPRKVTAKPARLQAANPNPDVAFVGVTVIPMVREEMLDDMTVVVAKGRIRDMGSAEQR